LNYNKSMKSEVKSSQLWTATSLAAEAGVAKSYVARLCRTGRISAQKFGSVWMISDEEGRRWLDERATKSKLHDAALTTEA